MRFFVLIFCLFIGTPSGAQETPDKTKEPVIEYYARLAHQGMVGAKVGDDHIVTEEEAAKLEYPLVPFDMHKRTIARGAISGMAEKCGLDWQKRSFLPYMKEIRATHSDWNEYQYAYISVLHGILQQQTYENVKDSMCSETSVKRLEKSLYK